MNTVVRCSICRLQMRNLKTLTLHYLKGHSKLKIVRQLLEMSISQLPRRNRNKGKLKNNPKKLRKRIEMNSESYQKETFYLNENFRIVCGQKEIIVGDVKRNIDMEFSFDESSSDSKESVPSNDISSGEHNELNYSHSASSEGTTESFRIFKRKLKRKKVTQKIRHFCIDITKLQNLQSLDDQNGYFYTCYCREKYSEESSSSLKTDSRIITSDTESCSETSKTSFMPIIDNKIFCGQCGSGYKTEIELEEHMFVHESFCRLCNISFPCEYSFKQHMQLHIFRIFVCHICCAEFPFKETLLRHFDCHIEDRTFETVLDMEEEYKFYRYNFMNNNYNNSINSIICFLSERSDVHYRGYMLMKIICDICCTEVYLHDYDRHLQFFHGYIFQQCTKLYED